MYAALFLLPWVLMYAISSLVMNHAEHLGGPPPRPKFETAQEQVWRNALPESATPEQIEIALMEEFDLSGRSRVHHDENNGTIRIKREQPFGIRRATHRPATGVVTIESAAYGARRFLTELHYRRGFGWSSLQENAWGFSVDLFILTMLFWIVSGLWMWWSIRSTHRLGFLSLATGMMLYAMFLFGI